MKKKLMSLFLAASMTASAGSSAPAAAAEESGKITNNTEVAEAEINEEKATGQASEIVVALAADPNNLSPWNPLQMNHSTFYKYIYETLFDNRPAYSEYVPVLAEGYTVSEDGTSGDVTIRKGIKDTDGNDINADDVIYSYNVQIDGGYVARFNAFKSLEKIDDYTVRFNWNNEITGVGEVEWPLCNVLIFDQGAYENGNFAVMPVATGPYKVESFVAGSELVLVKNEDYWWDSAVGGERLQGHNANVDKMDFKVMEETAQHVIGLQNGTLDFSFNVPAEYLNDFMNDEKISVYRAASGATYFMVPNLNKPFLNDVNFRLAVFYALDNAQMAKAGELGVLNCFASPYFGEFYDYLNGKDESYESVTSLDLAKEYLAKTDYNGEEIILMTENSEAYKNACTMAVASLAQIGINVKLDAADSNNANSRLSDDSWDMFLAFFGGGTLIGGLNRVLNVGDFADGGSMGHNFDDKLHELYAAANSIEGFNNENIKALQDYTTENGYLFVFGHGFNNFVYNANKIGKLAYRIDGTTLSLGDCIYYAE